MKDNLQDLIQHTYGLGVIDLIKVTGTDKETQINAISEDKNVFVSGQFKNPLADFIGTFGMPNLGKLKTILGFEEYDDSSIINVTRKDNNPVAIHFETKTSDFLNDYRLMSKSLVEERVKTITQRVQINWNVEFEPSVQGIMRLKRQANAHSEEKNFTAKTDNGDLKIYFGDPSTHSANFVFHTDISGKLSKAWQWPVKEFMSIMDLPGDKTIRISDQGAAEITVDSGLAVYRYMLPAQAK